MRPATSGVTPTVAGVSLHDERELPAQIPSILNARIHSLRADRAVDMRGVTGEKESALAVARSLSVVQAETRQPRGVADSYRTICRLADHRLKFRERQSLCGDFLISWRLRLGPAGLHRHHSPRGRMT